ncbi:MAG: quinolinate synthase NadA [Clostridiales bacterium]|jgi:quinolinate synthase|nr:quinolinate synthase NadA [Clostridiales bacterium]
MKPEEYMQEIKRLKEERDAIILAHYYTDDNLQEIADYVGDSYYLSKVAREAKEQVIVFCGVKFMGESAKILNPHKTVLLPDDVADCPMAHMVTPQQIKQVRQEHEDLAVVCYINSTAQIKAESDVCVTSANALNIVKALKQSKIFFVPDQHLGTYVASKVPEKEFIFNDGYCHIHRSIQKEAVLREKALRPEAQVLVHPECPSEIVDLADYVGSTTGIIDYAAKSQADSFIVCTEIGILYELKKNNPNKNFYFVGEKKECADMKRITLSKLYEALRDMKYEVVLEEAERKAAEEVLLAMHRLAD